MDTGNGCVEISATPPAGHHVPPMVTGCMSAAGCHNSALGLGANAPEYSYGGMAYKLDKVTPAAGATIIVKMGDKLKQTTVSDNGEFFMVPGIAGMDAPTNESLATTSASGCPNVAPMVAPLAAGGGDCNKAGCHDPGGIQGVVYLP